MRFTYSSSNYIGTYTSSTRIYYKRIYLVVQCLVIRVPQNRCKWRHRDNWRHQIGTGDFPSWTTNPIVGQSRWNCLTSRSIARVPVSSSRPLFHEVDKVTNLWYTKSPRLFPSSFQRLISIQWIRPSAVVPLSCWATTAIEKAKKRGKFRCSSPWWVRKNASASLCRFPQ